MIDLFAVSRSLDAHGRVVRIVIADHKGSTPRETGTSMLVHADGAQGTIGGGRLEFDAVKRAVLQLGESKPVVVRRQPLGPSLGQCCGGSVTLVAEIWDAERLSDAARMAEAEGFYARRVEDGAAQPTKRGGHLLAHGWLTEPAQRARRPVYIYGAGHVGAALAGLLSPMPRCEVHVADTRVDFLVELPEGVQAHAAPHEAMAVAPADAAHFIMTPEHELDLDLCHRLLGREFAYAGLIGSATKWARFRKRLAALGHAPTEIDQIECPIGEPSLGKHPQEIAIGVAARLLTAKGVLVAREDVA